MNGPAVDLIGFYPYVDRGRKGGTGNSARGDFESEHNFFSEIYLGTMVCGPLCLLMLSGQPSFCKRFCLCFFFFFFFFS